MIMRKIRCDALATVLTLLASSPSDCIGFSTSKSKQQRDKINMPRLSWDAFTSEYETRVEPFTAQFAEEMILALLSGDGDYEENETCCSETNRGDASSNPKKEKRKKLLDIGCGTGAASLLALSNCDDLDVAVTDTSSSMLRRAEQRILENKAGLKSPLISAKVCDGESLPAEWSDMFDYAVANFSVIFFPNPTAGLKEMLRCLVPATGIASFTAWCDVEETPAFRVFPDAAAAICPELVLPKPSRITGSIETLTKMMKEAGFCDVKVVGPVAKTLKVSSPSEFYNRFALTSPPNVEMISKMDDGTKLKFKDHVMCLAKSRGGQEDGSVALNSSAYIAYGRKG